MKATSAIQAATEFGGFNLKNAAGMSAAEIREYFSRENFSAMFGPDEADQCGGYSLEECAEAVIGELGL